MAQPALLQREPESGSRKRVQVLDAAERLFLSEGYGPVSMDAVARTAGVSKATLYAHFPSKDQLFASIMAERGLSQMLEHIGYPPDATEMRAALLTVGDLVLRYMLQDRKLRIYRIAVAESVRFPELGRAVYENGPARTCAGFAAWLAHRHALGSVRTPDPVVATHHFMGMLRGVVFLRATLGVPPAPSEAEIQRTVAEATDAWLRAYGA